MEYKGEVNDEFVGQFMDADKNHFTKKELIEKLSPVFEGQEEQLNNLKSMTKDYDKRKRLKSKLVSIIVRLFYTYDDDGSNFLDKDEFRKLLKDFYNEMDQEEPEEKTIEEFMKLGENGLFSKEKLIEILSPIFDSDAEKIENLKRITVKADNRKELKGSMKQIIEELFDTYDTDGTKLMEEDEYRLLLKDLYKKMKMPLPGEETIQMFLDQGDNGFFSKEQLVENLSPMFEGQEEELTKIQVIFF